VSRPLRLGISPCPNDTFAFHALLTGEVETPGLELSIELHDVQRLNELALAGELDASKVSFHAALALAASHTVLPCGAALGFGVGPVVLAPRDRAPATPPRVLLPGAWTTATLLWQLFHPEPAQLEHVVFSDIVPALEAGTADLGVCIHEGRFTWQERGLELVEDLGTTWEEATGAALPLGGIVARRDLGEAALTALARGVRASIDWARAHPDDCLPTMRAHAQEFDDDVLRKHVELYVNDWTVDLGDVGRAALDALSARAAERGLLPGDVRELDVFRPRA
jgi:1,4-dihydroxy-6-naphthoate synthase